MLFENREDAGQKLARELERYRGTNSIVLALPRGGVEVGRVVAESLGVPLDVIVTRKIGAPGQPEYAIGAIAENGVVVINEDEVRRLGISQEYLDAEIARQRQEIRHRLDTFRDGRSLPDLRDRTVILVDDGIATGFTALAALQAIQAEKPERVVIATPVAPREVVSLLARYADDVVVLATPDPFLAVGYWYRRFDQLSDDDVCRQLAGSRQAR